MSQDRHPEYACDGVDRHDDDYVDMREALIPQAEAYSAAVEAATHERLLARGGALSRTERREWDTIKDSAFHAEMERLVKTATTRGVS